MRQFRQWEVGLLGFTERATEEINTLVVSVFEAKSVVWSPDFIVIIWSLAHYSASDCTLLTGQIVCVALS
jgi:hypothetical protein